MMNEKDGKPDRKFWGRYGFNSYDTLLKVEPYVANLNEVADAVDPKIGWRILDAACGTGSLLKLLHEREPDCRFDGVDFSQEMLDLARAKVGAYAKLQNADLCETLPYDDASFHAVASVQTLYSLPEPQKALKEFRRVLRRNGRLVIVNAYDMKPLRILAAHYAAAWRDRSSVRLVTEVRNAPAITLLLGINALLAARRKSLNCWGVERMRFEVESAGFRMVRARDDAYERTSVFMVATAI